MKLRMESNKGGFDEIVRHGLVFVLWLALVLGGLGFASVFAVALLVGGIYLVATGHPSGGYVLAGVSVLTGDCCDDLGVGGYRKICEGER